MRGNSSQNRRWYSYRAFALRPDKLARYARQAAVAPPTPALGRFVESLLNEMSVVNRRGQLEKVGEVARAVLVAAEESRRLAEEESEVLTRLAEAEQQAVEAETRAEALR